MLNIQVVSRSQGQKLFEFVSVDQQLLPSQLQDPSRKVLPLLSMHVNLVHPLLVLVIKSLGQEDLILQFLNEDPVTHVEESLNLKPAVSQLPTASVQLCYLGICYKLVVSIQKLLQHFERYLFAARVLVHEGSLKDAQFLLSLQGVEL